VYWRLLGDFARRYQLGGVPKRSVELLNGPASATVWPALMQTKKIDIATLEAAAKGGLKEG
jgi:hypothetical protein